MATEQELKVKFKIDSSEVKKGSDEAKQKVKDTASEMASDVKQSSDTMEKHLDKVADSAKNIGTAANQAGNGIKGLESQVAQSSEKMKDDLGQVAEQVKKISAMQLAHIGARGLGIAANAVGWVGENLTEEGSEGRMYSDVGQGALSGAASGLTMGAMIGSVIPGIGTAVGAGIGAAAGALIGAGTTLYEAGKKLDEAAEEQQKNAEQAFKAAGHEKYERDRLTGYQKESEKWLKRLNEEVKPGQDKYANIDAVYEEQKARQKKAEEAQRKYDEFVSKHQYDSGQQALDNQPMLEALRRGVQVTQERLQAFAPVVAAAAQMEQQFIKAEEDEIRAREDAAARIAEAARREAEARQKAAEATIQKHAQAVADKDRLAGYGKENQELLKNSGLKGVAEAQTTRRAELEKAINERDEYVRQNQNVTGEAAVEVAQRLAELDHAVDEAKEHFESLSPLVKDLVKEGNERKNQLEESIADTQSALQGVISKPFLGGSPSDALTKIGGGSGYASFNNSAAQVQQRIENHLKSLMNNQKVQLQRIVDKLNELQPNEAGTWGA